MVSPRLSDLIPFFYFDGLWGILKTSDIKNEKVGREHRTRHGLDSSIYMKSFIVHMRREMNRNTTVYLGSVPVDVLRPKFRVAQTKHDVISILMNKYTYINMYIIKKIISCIFILC